MEIKTTKFSIQKILNVFGSSAPRATVVSAENAGLIPPAERRSTGSVRVRQWDVADVPKIGARYGFLKKPLSPVVVAVFTTKGGVLKTTLSLNIARMAALHDIKTAVVGLDLQGDITNALGFESDVSDDDSIDEAMEELDEQRGLNDIFAGDAEIEDVMTPTDLPTLSAIPETPELAILERSLVNELAREGWLKTHVTDKLKKDYDLIILDCGPSWNLLVTNAIAACDVLISPLECKINNFRNLKVFRSFTDSFREKLKLDFEQIFIPTRLTSTRKLSTAIRAWYMSNLSGCTNLAIRESTAGEESVAAQLSLPEYAPKSIPADEMRELLVEIWSRFPKADAKQKKRKIRPEKQSRRAAAS